MTIGEAFSALCEEVKEMLKRYAELLEARCPASASFKVAASAGLTATFATSANVAAATSGDDIHESVSEICYVINTADYCAEVNIL